MNSTTPAVNDSKDTTIALIVIGIILFLACTVCVLLFSSCIIWHYCKKTQSSENGEIASADSERRVKSDPHPNTDFCKVKWIGNGRYGQVWLCK